MDLVQRVDVRVRIGEGVCVREVCAGDLPLPLAGEEDLSERTRDSDVCAKLQEVRNRHGLVDPVTYLLGLRTPRQMPQHPMISLAQVVLESSSTRGPR